MFNLTKTFKNSKKGRSIFLANLVTLIIQLIWCSAEGRAPTYYRGSGARNIVCRILVSGFHILFFKSAHFFVTKNQKKLFQNFFLKPCKSAHFFVTKNIKKYFPVFCIPFFKSTQFLVTKNQKYYCKASNLPIFLSQKIKKNIFSFPYSLLQI